MNIQRNKGRSVTDALPAVRYELIDKDGKPVILRTFGTGELRALTFETAAGAAEYACTVWPDQEQDPDRTGKGWGVQVCGS